MSTLPPMLIKIQTIDDLSTAIAAIPYAALLGINVRADERDEPLFCLPFQDANIGNTFLPALHGGVIGGFMENAAVLYLMWQQQGADIPRVIDFSIDYLRSGRPQDLYCQCEIVRQGKRIANVLISAWQDDQTRPIAQARAHFLLSQAC